MGKIALNAWEFFKPRWAGLMWLFALGMLTNVGVAWWCSREGERSYRRNFPIGVTYRYFTENPPESGVSPLQRWSNADASWSEASLARLRQYVVRPAGPVVTSLTGQQFQRAGFASSREGMRLSRWFARDPRELTNWIYTSDPFTFNVVEAGWPFRAFRAEQWFDGPAVLTPAAAPCRSEGDAAGWIRPYPSTFYRVGWISPLGYALPAKPMWVPAIANTIVYMAAWWLSVTLSASAWRHARGPLKGCQTCGYDVGQLSICPECGVGQMRR